MKKIVRKLLCISVMLICVEGFVLVAQNKTSFQIAEKWLPDYDVRSDVAILYGMDSTFQSRYQSWKRRGYQIQFMTGIAWGEYQDYFTGKFDGQKHFDDAQIDAHGDTIWHGKNVPYVNPSPSYLSYMKVQAKKAIDAGATAIYLEEPEYWATAGYGDAFQTEWERFYGIPWVAQHLSPEATYLSSKLKYHLFYNALNEVFTSVKQYARETGKDVKCYVPTHSLLNYAAWKIVSPEASLASLPVVDGYIAQVWTGTSRVPVYFNGEKKERVFENAFLEYGTVYSMVKPTGRTVYFLTDPIEDGVRSWNDYKRNYQATFTAELLYPEVDKFEVMPWPNRIYLGKFPVEGKTDMQPIAPQFATQMQVMINSLNDMPKSKNRVGGTQGVGVLLANSIMFQRFPEHQGYDDPQLSDFYGMAMPLLKRGLPVEIVHIENLRYEQALKNIKVLIMTYSNMKPLSADAHAYLAQWVKKGGVLCYVGRDDDLFQKVSEWWNSNENHYNAPSAHLFQQLGIRATDARVKYSCGKGFVYVMRRNPKELVLQAGQDGEFVQMVKEAYQHKDRNGWHTKNSLYLERGPYTIAAVMTENEDTSPMVIARPVIDLFDPLLPVLDTKKVYPGEQAFLYDLDHNDKKAPAVLCSAARVEKENFQNEIYSLTVKSPSGTENVMRVLLPRRAGQVQVVSSVTQHEVKFASNWDEKSKTLWLRFPNSADGIDVEIQCK